MSLWGNKDAYGSTGLLTVTSGTAASGVDTQWGAGATGQPGEYLIADGVDDHYLIVSVTNTGEAIVIPAAGATGELGSTSFTISTKPQYIVTSESTSSGDSYDSGNPEAVFGVDANEITSAGATAIDAHTGWVRRIVGSSGRAGRVQYETLVAGGITGDASDDSEFPET